ncbi:transglycosylase SLT domain-containing protein [Methylomonas sp. MS20]|uniref:transglycosylase SLT domain-containing protein n=1 Tax=unclassified Methylomonas TaxID=2608980 RepID=UPI0028A415EF|nr:transglycosylase SLT domain-containing protein [Methylomonas sp. MV1]MDT4328507.1 transglycosylase SLT domain-containing protein [Methylomonas sp. MV1]
MQRRQLHLAAIARELLAMAGSIVVICLVAQFCASPAHAAPVPRAAVAYRADLTRIAHAEWGLDAPVAAFAAQVHQESGWRPEAVSRVGARGMAQFMPATAAWWCQVQRLPAEDCQPANPVWSLRALVGYDRWLYQRVKGDNAFDKHWAALRAYNGGLGHWLNEAKAAPSLKRAEVDGVCGAASRSAVHCAENLGYPRRILLNLQPLYAAWGGSAVSEVEGEVTP